MSITEEFAHMAETADLDEALEACIKTVSLRLDAIDLAHIDVIAEEVRWSRQAVIEKLVVDSIWQALRGVVDARLGNDPKQNKEYLEALNQRVIDKYVQTCADAGVTVEYHGWALRVPLNAEECRA